jgi:hypothetical protein
VNAVFATRFFSPFSISSVSAQPVRLSAGRREATHAALNCQGR